jgi:maltose alpha-D-glucosyltransferase/alpha-amylase
LPEARPSGADQSNTSVLFGDQLVLKTVRRLERGRNPDVELGAVFERRGFLHAAPLAGSVALRGPGGEESTVAVMHQFVPHEQLAWDQAVDAAGRFFEQVLSCDDEESTGEALATVPALLERVGQEPPRLVEEHAGDLLSLVELLGRRTAELHAVLADPEDPELAPESVSALYQRGVYQSMRTSVRRALNALRRGRENLPDELRARAEELVGREDVLIARVQAVTGVRTGSRIRIHGDLHLGQILATGRDFVFIDFEGEPARPLSERRIKRTPLRDVAGLLRSFDYAGRTAARDLIARGRAPDEPETHDRLRPWSERWSAWVGASLLGGYLAVPEIAPVLASSSAEIATCLDAHLVDKAAYELQYELAHRPDWVAIPVDGLLGLTEPGS